MISLLNILLLIVKYIIKIIPNYSGQYLTIILRYLGGGFRISIA